MSDKYLEFQKRLSAPLFSRDPSENGKQELAQLRRMIEKLTGLVSSLPLPDGEANEELRELLQSATYLMDDIGTAAEEIQGAISETAMCLSFIAEGLNMAEDRRVSSDNLCALIKQQARQLNHSDDILRGML
ncbi:MAG: hypothetical protein BGO63_13920 [Candidatus Accumulibacter sp. 66-26]|nr:hypothetical protein [Accumulibacter sp.]OJW46050.1 MAG: hypothetical protein BGO63_13920 [Candidatus Accumulibacter sp. 66-26]